MDGNYLTYCGQRRIRAGMECDRLHCGDTIGPCDSCPHNPEGNRMPTQPSNEDLRAIYSAASHYLRALYADQPSPHATKDNAVRLALIAESLHHAIPQS
jgi:hypothetical protein